MEAVARRIVDLDSVVTPETREQAKELGLTCGICLGLLQIPVETRCGHLFCAECLGAAASCPFCRSPLLEGSKPPVAPATAAFQRLLAGLRCRCPHGQQEQAPKRRKAAAASADACDWTGCYGDLLSKHLRACPWEPATCPRGCGKAGLRRKDVDEHLDRCCPIGERCEICGKNVPLAGKAEHDRRAAEQHVEVLRRRCDDLQRSFATSRAACAAVWRLRAGSAAEVAKGGSLATSMATFDQAGWPIPVQAKLRFFPRGAEASKIGHAAVEVQFDEADCEVQVSVLLVTAGCAAGFARDAWMDLSRSKAHRRITTWENFCSLSDDDLAGEIRLHIQVRGVGLVLRRWDSDTSCSE